MANNQQKHKSVIIQLPIGQIEGISTKTIYDSSYNSFEGIPYAKPPLGELRFKAPVPAEPWTGIKDCTNFSTKCMQRNLFTGIISGSEDCLYLNVYTKSVKTSKPLPVMVWIHGGGFSSNAATRETHSPDYLLKENIVLVTLNYRLCSLGFLSLADPELEIPGNAGLKDQILALKWVKQYISYFNGDPNNITLFGVSAGAVCVHYLTLSEQTKGMFHKAIAMGGSVLNAWANNPPLDFAFRLAKFNGYTGENVDKEVLNFLRTLKADNLVNHNLLNDTDFRNGRQFAFGPVVEPYVGSDCVVPKLPKDMLPTGWGNEIPMIMGGTSFEGLLMYPRLKRFPQSMLVIAKDPERMLPLAVRESHTSEENQQFVKKLIELHFENKPLNEEALFNYLDYFSYSFLWHGVHRATLARLKYATAPTYLYRFDFDSPKFNFNRINFCGPEVRGVAHADDTYFMFFCKQAWKLSTDSIEYKTIRRMVSMWTNFAALSNPNCAKTKAIYWEPLKNDDPYQALNVGEELSILQLPEMKKLEIWDTFYPKDLL